MKITLKLARAGMTMQAATITEWLKKPGDSFAGGDPLYSFETEKANEEVPAPGAGKLLEILAPAGEEVKVGAPVCVIDLST